MSKVRKARGGTAAAGGGGGGGGGGGAKGAPEHEKKNEKDNDDEDDVDMKTTEEGEDGSNAGGSRFGGEYYMQLNYNHAQPLHTLSNAFTMFNNEKEEELKPKKPAALNATPTTTAATNAKKLENGKPIAIDDDKTKSVKKRDCYILVVMSQKELLEGAAGLNKRQIWGTGVYTHDSDIVAVLVHTGYLALNARAGVDGYEGTQTNTDGTENAAGGSASDGASQQLLNNQHPHSIINFITNADGKGNKLKELRITIKLEKRQFSYVSSSIHGLRSRAWGSISKGCSFSVHSVTAIIYESDTTNNQTGARAGAGAAPAPAPAPDSAPAPVPTETGAADAGAAVVGATAGGAAAPVEEAVADDRKIFELPLYGCDNYTPTYAPLSVERAVHTRSNASNMEKRQRFVTQVAVAFNLCNEPWLKYSLHEVADRGLSTRELTSAKLMEQVLFLETQTTRYELTWLRTDTLPATGAGAPTTTTSSTTGAYGNAKTAAEVALASGVEMYRLCQCKRPLTMKKLRETKLPLEESEIEGEMIVVSWDQILWFTWGIIVDGQKYAVSKMLFAPRTD